MATSKIKQIIEKTYQGKVTGHSIVLEDGTVGYLDDKGSDKVSQGDLVDYTLAVHKNKQGKDYNLLTLKHAQSQAEPPKPPIKPPMPTQSNATVAQAKTAATNQALRFAIDAFIADKILYDKIKDTFNELRGYLYDAIDEISGQG